MRVRRWEMPDEPLPGHPYRNTIIFHLFLACMLVLVAWLTDGGMGRAVGFAVGYFVIATAYSSWRWRQRLAEERRRQERRAGRGAARPSPRRGSR